MSPDRNEIVERERRWMRPAGIASLLAVAGILIGSIIRGGALEGDSISEQLLNAADGDEDGRLLFSAILSGLGFALTAVPLTFLFIAARNRSERVVRQMIGLAVIGGLLIGAGQLASNFAFVDAADDFAASEAQRGATEEEPDAGAGEGATQDQAERGGDGGEPARGGEAEGGAETTVEATTTTEGEASDSEDAEEDAEDEADDRADEARDNASGATLSQLLGTAGGLAFAIALLYTSLWAMRVGLLTRFWGSLGMAAAVVSLLLPPFFIVLLVWFFALGMLLTGAWFGGRPPAWEAGTAIPWPRPGGPPDEGDPPQEGDGRDIEGRGRELSDEDEAAEGPEGPPDSGEPPRKRKRRR